MLVEMLLMISEADEGKMAEYEKIAEVEAFMARFNYFRRPYNKRNPTNTRWVWEHRLAGDRIVKDALNGKGDIGLLLNKNTTFICFDIDPKKEEEDARAGEADRDGGDEAVPDRVNDGGDTMENGDNRENLLKVDKGDGGSVSVEGGSRQGFVKLRNMGSEGAEGRERGEDGESGRDRKGDRDDGGPAKGWAGWKELGIGNDANWRETMAAIEAMPRAPMIATRVRQEFKRELGPELREAVGMLVECFNEEPSLIVKSPHGCHVYWCLETEEPSFEVRPKLVKVRREWIKRAKDRGIMDIGIEVLPSTSKPLRVPRKDRLIEPRNLEPMEGIKDGEAFWRSLKRYPFEGLIKEEVLNRKAEDAKRPGLRLPNQEGGEEADKERAELEAVEGIKREAGAISTEAAGGVGVGSRAGSEGAEAGGQDDNNILSLRPKNRIEAEGMFMPFRNRETNPQLIKMIEGAKSEGLSLEEVIVWILSWEGRSREAGYRGDLFYNRELLKDRIAALFATSTATAAGAKRFIELWNSKNMGYVRNDKATERVIEELDRITQQPKRSRRAVRRFLADIDAWKRIIDDATADPASGLDETTRRNRASGRYPLPYALLRVMYSGCDRVWKDIQAAGIVVKAEGIGGQYVPNIGRPQYYHINVSG
jgi:hypothetical protein